MANLGTRGLHQQNCHRDLCRMMGSTNPVPDPVGHPVLTRLPRQPLLGDTALPLDVLYPHQVFSVVANKFPAMFAKWK
eukprot:1262737-Alexandrium_andersonii.AAC.1